MPVKIVFTKKQVKEIVNLYLKKQLSMEKIGKIFSCNESVITRVLLENKIKIFPLGFHNLGEKRPRRKDIDERRVVEMYSKESISSIRIAKIFKCSDVHILNILKKNNISRYPSGFFNKGRHSWNYGLTKNDERVKRYAEKLIGHECYKDPVRNKKISDARMGQHSWNKGVFGEEYLKHFPNGQSWNKDITHVEDPRILSGDKIHTFNNWSSFEPYGKDFNTKLKKEVRKRDNHTCQMCSIEQEKTYRKLDVHHIDYNKTNNTIHNLIALCFKCHLKTNLNRPKWQTFFQKLLSKKYGYKYEPIKIKMEAI